MGRENKICQRVFLDVVGKKNELPAYGQFVLLDSEFGITKQPELKTLRDHYNVMVKSIEPKLKELAQLEELMIQLRSRELIKDEIKLTLQRQYIYARSTFFRNDKETMDVRAIIGKTDTYGKDLNLLYNNPAFMKKAVKSLYDVMTIEIDKLTSKTLKTA